MFSSVLGPSPVDPCCRRRRCRRRTGRDRKARLDRTHPVEEGERRGRIENVNTHNKDEYFLRPTQNSCNVFVHRIFHFYGTLTWVEPTGHSTQIKSQDSQLPLPISNEPRVKGRRNPERVNDRREVDDRKSLTRLGESTSRRHW